MRNVDFTVWCIRQLEGKWIFLKNTSGPWFYVFLGDKDHAKVYEAVEKVEKTMGIGSPWSGSSHRARSSDVPYKGRGLRSSAPVQCYFRGKFGHVMAR